MGWIRSGVVDITEAYARENRPLLCAGDLQWALVNKYLVPPLAVLGLFIGIGVTYALNNARNESVFDLAFDTFSLEQLEKCDGFSEQKKIFDSKRNEFVGASASEKKVLEEHWSLFVNSSRGETPSGCSWTIEPYPAGFIVTGNHTVIVINPSNSVVGAPLPEGTTGDFVMDATRYSATSLGAFRGAATIPPRSLAVIALRTQ